MGRLTGQRAWVTGGGSGIGASGAEAMAASGAEVIVSGRRAEPLDAVVERIRAAGGTASARVLDIADQAAVAQAAEEIGPIDILVASAGTNVPKRSLADVTPEGWDQVVSVNLNGIFYQVHAVLPGMRARGGGLIILVSSWAGQYVTRLTGAAYNSTKRGVIALGETINTEECGNGIRSTVIMPGEVATDILKSRPKLPTDEEMGRMLQAEDLGETIRFVAEMPPRACLNEILISPTWNRFYLGMDEV